MDNAPGRRDSCKQERMFPVLLPDYFPGDYRMSGQRWAWAGGVPKNLPPPYTSCELASRGTGSERDRLGFGNL